MMAAGGNQCLTKIDSPPRSRVTDDTGLTFQAYLKMSAGRVYFYGRGGMFCPVMRLNRTVRAAFSLLFALLLPLQGSTATWDCGRLEATTSDIDRMAAFHIDRMTASHIDRMTPSDSGHMAASPAAHTHCAPGSDTTHRHSCGNGCCGAAIALTAIHWIAPPPTTPEISVADPGSPPTVTLDRLDRPPRFIPA
jgi:hypothetical protein